MHTKIIIPEPKWDSELTGLIVALEKVRTKQLVSVVPANIFWQLKNIFQTLETLGSSRIEGNHTTLAEYVEQIIEHRTATNEQQTEIDNLRKAIVFIEENTTVDTPINRRYLSHLHSLVVKGLTPPPKGEGSNNPGALRQRNVKIKQAQHTPPDIINLDDYFNEFIKFINTQHSPQNQLLMVAIAHHRCAYIHPFDNGNGRITRLLDYVLLIKLGFNVKKGRILNPSAVFYGDRNAYYDNLSKADDLSNNGVLHWSSYFLNGLKNEIEKIDTLLNLDDVRNKLLLPALRFAQDRQVINALEYGILRYLVNKDCMTMRSTELDKFDIDTSIQKTRMMNKLKRAGLIKAIKKMGRIYTINFYNSPILRGVVKALDNNGFISEFLNRGNPPSK